jgi:hypothetical protein
LRHFYISAIFLPRQARRKRREKLKNDYRFLRNLNAKSRDFHVLLDRHLEYMRDKNTPLDLQDRVLEYLSYQQASRLAQTEEDETMMAALSPSLQMELTQSIYVPVLQAIPLFSRDIEFVEDLAMWCAKRHCLSTFYMNMIILARQARDKHRENSKQVPF